MLPSGLVNEPWFDDASRAVASAWTALVVGVVALGAFIGLRRDETRPGTVLLTIPVVSFLAVTLVAIGDPRFRLPVAPFYTALIAVALVRLAQRALIARLQPVGESRGTSVPTAAPSSGR